MDMTNSEVTVVAIDGLQRNVTLLHVTDSHMTEVDERNPESIAAGLALKEKLAARSPEGVPPRQHFRRALARARAVDADYVVLTGDIIHFPSAANLEALDSELQAAGLPFLYTPGNHDWHFPHLIWSDETRATYYPDFYPFTGGNPAYQAHDIAGVRLVAIDNSNYQVTDEQLAFLENQLASRLACLLLMHIPLAIPSLVPDVMAAWGAPIMMAASGWTADSQASWKVRDSDPSTRRCHKLLTEEAPPNLIGILCGHVHFDHTDALGNGRFQYVTGPGFAGSSRVIRLIPS